MPGVFIYEPFKLREDRAGIAVTDDADRHLRDRILAILFTAPGERVNQPRFGVGLDRTLFEGMDELTIASVEFHVIEGLRRDLGEDALIDGVDIEVRPDGAELIVQIRYRRRTDRRARSLEVAL